MRKTFWIALGLICLPALAAVAPRGTQPRLGIRDYPGGTVALTGAKVITAPGRSIDDATLILRDGRIVAVGRDLDLPADAFVRDLAGKTIYPGLVDPYTDYGLPRGEGRSDEPGERGFGRSRRPDRETPGPVAWNDALHPATDWVERFEPDAEAAEVFLDRGVTVVQSARLDGILRGHAFVATLGDGAANDRVLAARSAQMVAFDKGSSRQAYPSSLMGSIALLRQTFLDADWYVAAERAWAADTAQPRTELNVELAALAAWDGPFVFETEDEQSLLRAARVATEFALPAVHLGSNREYARLDEIAALGQPIILPLDFPEPPRVGSFEDGLDVTLARLREWERAPSTAAALEARGVTFAFTGHGLERKADFLAAVRRTIARGLAPDAALAALTVRPARLCGVERLVGTLEPGKLANFVVTDGDLFAEGTRILSVWVEGRPAREEVPLEQRDLRGRYAIEIDERPIEIRLGGKIDKLDGRIVSGEEKIALRGIETGLGRASFTADLEALGLAGTTRFTIAPVGDLTRVDVTLPDGRRLALDSAPAPAEPAEDDDERTEREGRREDDARLVSRLTYPDAAFGLERAPERESVLVRGATLWTLDERGRVEGADMLVVDGKIRQIGPSLAAPRGARIVDAAGKHVTPGIIDEHSHIAIARGVNEGSHAVTAEVRIGDVIDPDDVAIYRALAGGVTAAQLLHGSANPIGGQAQVIKLRWGASAEGLKLDGVTPTIKLALGENVKQSSFEASTRYPQTRMGVETIIEDAFLAARDHAAAVRAHEALPDGERRRTVPPRRDLQLEALAEILEGRRLTHVHSYKQSEILMLMRLAERLGFRVQTFTHILEGYKVAPEMAAHGAGGSSFSDWWAYKFEVYDAIPHNICLMHEAGVVASVNSDSADVMRRLNQEAAKSVMYCGMDEVEALKLATLNPARQLRIDDRVGSLEAGKDADFVVWSGHPLSARSRVEQTWIEGASHFDVERDRRLRAENDAERTALVQKALRAAKEAGPGGRRDGGKRREPEWHCDDVEDVWDE